LASRCPQHAGLATHQHRPAGTPSHKTHAPGQPGRELQGAFLTTAAGPREDPSPHQTLVLGEDRCGRGRKSPLKSDRALPGRQGGMQELKVPRKNQRPPPPAFPPSWGMGHGGSFVGREEPSSKTRARSCSEKILSNSTRWSHGRSWDFHGGRRPSLRLSDLSDLGSLDHQHTSRLPKLCPLSCSPSPTQGTESPAVKPCHRKRADRPGAAPRAPVPRAAPPAAQPLRCARRQHGNPHMCPSGFQK